MKWFDLTHNTDEWYLTRAGMATSSSFDKIITPTGKPSAQAESYANQIVAELMLGKPIERGFSNYSTEWGHENEGNAQMLYCINNDVDIKSGGFFCNDELTLGTSPDCIVLKDGKEVGICEIKCPENPSIHVEFMLAQKINPKYIPQVQGQLLITGFEWCDWFSYHPELPDNQIRIYRDEVYIEKLKSALDEFNSIVKGKLHRLKELGHIEEIPAKLVKY